MFACQLNHLSIADRLIEAGADFELPLEVSYTIEHERILSPQQLTMRKCSVHCVMAQMCQFVTVTTCRRIKLYYMFLDPL